jgi:hypothetical protein
MESEEVAFQMEQKPSQHQPAAFANLFKAMEDLWPRKRPKHRIANLETAYQTKDDDWSASTHGFEIMMMDVECKMKPRPSLLEQCQLMLSANAGDNVCHNLRLWTYDIKSFLYK